MINVQPTVLPHMRHANDELEDVHSKSPISFSIKLQKLYDFRAGFDAQLPKLEL